MARVPSLTDLTQTKVESDSDPTILDLADEEAEEVFGALQSSTARQLLQRLHESPTYPANLADEMETSIQNIHYHLSNLEEAGAVEVVDTVYSEKGREMKIYAPAADPLVLVSSSEDNRRRLVNALSKLLGGIGVLALASVGIQELVQRLFYPGGPQTLAAESGHYASPPLTNVPPPVGLYVFLAGLGVLLCWLVWRSR